MEFSKITPAVSEKLPYMASERKFRRFVEDFGITGVAWHEPLNLSAGYYMRLLKDGTAARPRGRGKDHYLCADTHSREMGRYEYELFDHGALFRRADGSIISIGMPYGTQEQCEGSFKAMCRQFGFPEDVKIRFLGDEYKYRPNGDCMLMVTFEKPEGEAEQAS